MASVRLRETIGFAKQRMTRRLICRPAFFFAIFSLGSDLFLCGHLLSAAASNCGAVAKRLTVIGVGSLPKLPGRCKGRRLGLPISRSFAIQ